MLAQPEPTHPAAAQDRFIGFAFASADLLVETDLDGMVTFATGAFRTRLGTMPSWYLGRSVCTLFVPADQQALHGALTQARTRGRIAPVVLRLADAKASPSSVAAMLMPETGGGLSRLPARFCFSIGPVPQQADAERQPVFQDRRGFLRLAEDAMRAGQSGGLGLLSLPGRRHVSPTQKAALQDSITRALEDSAPGAATGDLGDGRFGILSQTTLDIDLVVARLDVLLQSAGQTGAVAGSQMSLDATGLPPAQAVRALRYALGRFAAGQSSPEAAIGDSFGLAGIIATAETRARNIRSTIIERRFRLVFQPVVGLQDRRVHHYEALFRPLPVEGQPAQSVQDFVAFAEMVGLSEDLDWAVLQMALDALRDSHSASVAVNMSGLSMQSSAYQQRLLARLAEAECLLGPASGARLLIELTETAEIDDLDAAAAAMTNLRKAGVPVCLDDFGAGAAAFRYLRTLPVDYVKIDGAYVHAASHQANHQTSHHDRDRSMLASMVEISTSAGAAVIAEAIETEEQAGLMLKLGISYGQGWLFGRPGSLPGSR